MLIEKHQSWNCGAQESGQLPSDCVLRCSARRLGSLLLSQLASRQLPLEPGIKVLDGLRSLITNGQPEAVMCRTGLCPRSGSKLWISTWNMMKYVYVYWCTLYCMNYIYMPIMQMIAHIAGKGPPCLSFCILSSQSWPPVSFSLHRANPGQEAWRILLQGPSLVDIWAPWELRQTPSCHGFWAQALFL